MATKRAPWKEPQCVVGRARRAPQGGLYKRARRQRRRHRSAVRCGCTRWR